jgi:hypothetical protein
MGRRTALVLDRIMAKGGEHHDLLTTLKLAKKEGLSAEHVADAFYDKAAKVMDDLIPKQKWETDLLHKVANDTPLLGHNSNFRKGITNFYSRLFMGWSMGYAMRNFFDNSARLVVNGVNPFTRPAKRVIESTGVHVMGSRRGIGQIGGSLEAKVAMEAGRSMGPGARAAQKFEQLGSEAAAGKYYLDALNHFWPKAIKDMDIPADIKGIIKHAAKYDISLIDELIENPAKAADAWRTVDDGIIDLIDATEPHLTERVTNILVKAEAPEEALASLRMLQQEAAEFMAEHTGKMKAMGPAEGTLARQAVDMAADSGRVGNLEKLGEELSALEHTLQMSRNKAVASALEAANPDTWTHVLRTAEEVYGRQITQITRRQTVGYAQLLTGRLDEASYSKYLQKLYSDAQTALDGQYKIIIENVGKVTGDLTNPQVQERLLRSAVARSAYSVGYPSVAERGMTEAVQLIRNQGNTPIPDAHFINKVRKLLREGMGLGDEQAKAIKSINDLSTEQMTHVVNTFTGGTPRSTQEIIEWAGKRVDQATLDEFGPLGTRPMRPIPDVTDPDKLLDTLRLQQDEMGKRLDDLDALIPKAKAEELAALRATRGRLAKEFDRMNEALDDLVAQADMKEMRVIADATGDAKTIQVLESVKLIDNMPLRTPTALDSLASSNSRIIESLDAVVDNVKSRALLPAKATTGISDATAATIKSRYNETQILATEMGRRGRDLSLLDYADRRYMDPLIQMAFPWHYWWSRSIPNWGISLTQRPDIIAKYMRAKRELKEHTDQQTDIPEWAKDQVPIRVPGYPGTIYWNYDGAFNAVGTIFDTFEDEDRTHDAFGKLIQTMGNIGPAPHPMLMAAYAAERGLQGDTAGLRSYGYLSGHTRMVTTFTGKVLEPWLWLRDPVTNELQPFKGGTKWDIEKSVRKLGYDISQGRTPLESGLLGAATHAGPAFEDALRSIQVSDPNAQSTLEAMGGYRRLPTLLSNLLGLRVTVRQDWENELSEATQEYSALREAGQDQMAQAHLDANPWMSAVWMSWDNDQVRMEMLAKNVLHRIPPMPGIQRTALIEKAGLTKHVMDMFYRDTAAAKKLKEAGTPIEGSPLANWDKRDYNNFATAILNMAEILQIPNSDLAGEWRTARKQWSKINEDMDEKYPTGRAEESAYFIALETQGKEAARELLQASPSLGDFWKEKNHALAGAPLVLKYYKDQMKIDTIANSLSWEDVETKFGADIFDLRRLQGEIPDNEWWTKREFRRQFPQVAASYDYQKESLLRHNKGLSYLREYVLTDEGAPETISYIVEGRPNAAQAALLEFIDEMAYEAKQPQPLPEVPPEKWTPASKEYFKARDNAYAVAVAKYPDLPALQTEYQRIKETFGDDASKLFAQKAGMYKMWDAITLEEIKHPLTLRQLKPRSLEFAAKALVRREADEMWPGLMDMVENEYYAIPKARKKDRRRWRDEHPSYISYLNWKDGAKGHYLSSLQMEQNRLKAMNPEQIAQEFSQ